MERKLKRAIRKLQKSCERHNAIIDETAVLSGGLERWHRSKGCKTTNRMTENELRIRITDVKIDV